MTSVLQVLEASGVPAVPDFSRMPVRRPEPAQYRDRAPRSVQDNPFYLALPATRSTPEVSETIEAGNPTFDPTVRTEAPAFRRECIDDLDTVIFALHRHRALEDMVMTTIRNAYRDRPWHARYVDEEVDRSCLAGQGSSRCGVASVGSGALFGSVGSGKTVSLKRILIACPQVIDHRTFRGQYVGIRQVAWLYVPMPPKASAYGFLAWIASTLDFVLGTNYRRNVETAQNMALKTAAIANALALHSVGAIFVDELQNLKVGTHLERSLLENIIQELVNYTHTRFVFIGTHESRGAVGSAALVRRMIGERGQQSWSAMDIGPEWSLFMQRLWEWQPTIKPTVLTEELITYMHQLTGGVADTAKRLFQATLARVIGNPHCPDEQITVEILTKTMEVRFTELHRRLQRRQAARC